MAQEAKMTPLTASALRGTETKRPLSLSIEETVDTHQSGSASSPSTSHEHVEAADKPRSAEETETPPPKDGRNGAGKAALGRPARDKGNLLNLSLSSGRPQVWPGSRCGDRHSQLPRGRGCVRANILCDREQCKAFGWSLIADIVQQHLVNGDRHSLWAGGWPDGAHVCEEAHASSPQIRPTRPRQLRPRDCGHGVDGRQPGYLRGHRLHRLTAAQTDGGAEGCSPGC
mmetsp:Transcript_7306/g.21037  ORF Transcript_7306/g.21037 Transcript_7306/m.21037 type:complete len:228 (-) Transcript_7306:256-939(-)